MKKIYTLLTLMLFAIIVSASPVRSDIETETITELNQNEMVAGSDQMIEYDCENQKIKATGVVFIGWGIDIHEVALALKHLSDESIVTANDIVNDLESLKERIQLFDDKVYLKTLIDFEDPIVHYDHLIIKRNQSLNQRTNKNLNLRSTHRLARSALYS